MYKETPMDEVLLRRIKTLMVPISFFYCCDLLLRTILTALKVPAYESLIYILSLRNGGWFVIALFLCIILFNALYRATMGRETVLAVLVILIFSIGLISSYFEVSAESNLMRAFVALYFYYIGYLIGKLKIPKIIEKGSAAFRAIILSCSITVLLICAIWGNDYMVVMAHCDYGNPLLFTLKATVCSLAVISICVIIGHVELLERIGRQSLIMMILSFPVYLSLKAVYSHFLLEHIHSNSTIILINIMCIFVVFLITFFASTYIEKRWPIVAGHWPKEKSLRQ